jgi:hypothetical protein
MRKSRLATYFLCTVLATFLPACQRNVALKVQSEIPDPLVSKLTLSVGVYYADTFRRHEYTETTEERGNWRIETGDSQVKAFNRILSDLFSEFRELNSPQTDAVELVMIPEIAKMQFSTPEETGFDYFEAWVEYIITLRTTDGNELPTWRFTGYGQAKAERFAGFETSLANSLSDALRNAGAQLATGLPEHPPVRQRIRRAGL